MSRCGLCERRSPGRLCLCTSDAVVLSTLADVAAGDTLVVLEAMKLLQSLTAPVSGTVAEIYCAPGDTVAGQAPLVKLDPEETP